MTTNNALLTPDQRFDVAVNDVLKHEGKTEDNPNDLAGVTQYGISLRFLEDTDYDDPDHTMTVEAAKKIYKKYWWYKYNYYSIISSQLASKIFDMAVNMGAMEAHKIVQRSCNAMGESLIVDGVMGSKTLRVLNRMYLAGKQERLMAIITTNQIAFYKMLVEQHPRLEVFLKGWLKRASYQGT
jgi:lysozyme family protein